MSGTNLRGSIPHRIAADGFYEKASGVVALLEAVNAGASSDRSSIWASRKSTPIWVPMGGSWLSGPQQVFIGCPQCLRPFPQSLDAAGSPQETNCVHCLTPIDYAIVEQYATAR
jgi:hypothetical protein